MVTQLLEKITLKKIVKEKTPETKMRMSTILCEMKETALLSPCQGSNKKTIDFAGIMTPPCKSPSYRNSACNLFSEIDNNQICLQKYSKMVNPEGVLKKMKSEKRLTMNSPSSNICKKIA